MNRYHVFNNPVQARQAATILKRCGCTGVGVKHWNIDGREEWHVYWRSW